ncbi:MAG: ferrochelatase, partial [Angustibacter sp.]
MKPTSEQSTCAATDASLVPGLEPYDAILLLSFGGPDGPDDVLPFLRNVTAGRGIPDERLAEVAEHYYQFGGRSPINGQNRALLAALTAELTRRGFDRPVLWGNRNWHPYARDVLAEAADVHRVLCLPTSAYSSYSGCRQYREDLAAAQLHLAADGRLLEIDKIRPFANHPGFIGPNVEAALAALRTLPEGAELAFVTHSIPEQMDASSGGPTAPHAYSRQHLDVAETIATLVGAELGRAVPWTLVYCSRSGPPSQPWLEPDIGDHLRARAAGHSPGVAVCPIGFISDHMEVVFDLDTEAASIAAEVRLPFARAATVGG